MKHLPAALADWYFPFNWDTEELWKLDAERQLFPVKLMEWHLNMPFWSSKRGQGMLFDLTPTEVLMNPNAYPYHMNRINEADLRYPIYITNYNRRDIIIDGIHRLAKCVMHKNEYIKANFVSEIVLEEIAIYA